jgi:hypothetical protein
MSSGALPIIDPENLAFYASHRHRVMKAGHRAGVEMARSKEGERHIAPMAALLRSFAHPQNWFGQTVRAPSVRPLPIGNFRIIDTELPCVVLARDLLIEHSLADRRTGDAKAWYPVDRVNHQAEAVGLVSNRQL